MSDPQPFAFLVHPRRHVAEDLARVWRPLGRVPERYYDAALRRVAVPPTAIASVSVAGHAGLGQIVLVPYGAAHLLADPVGGAARVRRAVDHAARHGAEVVGLGALTAPVTAGGLAFRGRRDIGVTNGNAFTAAVLDRQVRDLLDGAVGPVTGGSVAVVGATGSVGSAVVRSLVRDRALDRLLLVARGAGRREALAAETAARVPTTTASTVEAVADADVVVLLTAAADSILQPHHLRPGAVVLDATQPRNTAAGLAEARPDVLLLDGGVVSVPSLRLSSPVLGLPHGHAFACLAETMLLSLCGHAGHFSLGNPTLDVVDRAREMAAAMAHLGFRPAPPASFGRPLPEPTPVAVPA